MKGAKYSCINIYGPAAGVNTRVAVQGMLLSVEYDTLCLMLFADRQFVSSTGDLLEGQLLEQAGISRLGVLQDCPHSR